MGKRNIWDTGQRNQKLEPVSSTSRPGARAAYHAEYPRDFGPRIAYTVSLTSDTRRPPIWQGGRIMSAPKPYIPFSNQLCSHPTLWSISLYLQNCSSYFFHVVFALCLKTLYVWNLRTRSSRTSCCKDQHHFKVILSSLWSELVRNTASLPAFLLRKLSIFYIIIVHKSALLYSF